MEDKQRSRDGGLSGLAVAMTWLLAASGTIAVLLIAAASAEGGTYRVAQCQPRIGAGASAFEFERTARDYEGRAECFDGPGLVVKTTGTPARTGAWGAWIATSPPTASITRLKAVASATPAGGQRPEVLVAAPDSEPKAITRVGAAGERVEWSGDGAERVLARLRCRRSSGCGPRLARLALRRIFLGLSDFVGPQAAIAGAPAAGQTQRGTTRLAASATDTGAGVRRVFVEVNGDPVAGRTLDCELRRSVALRIRPCPASAAPELGLDTTAQPFRQGPNELRVCAVDYAARGEANRDCAARVIRVDNECPINEGSAVRAVEAEIVADRRHGAIRYGDPARVEGRLLDHAGEPVGFSEACVATRVVLDDAVERVVATPQTDAQGRFAARLPVGPSREVRVAHWSGSERLAERVMPMLVSARPRLSLSDHSLTNGQRVRFRVKLHGPRRGGRQVYVKAYTGSRWVAVRSGHTDSRGRWSESYRFTRTTGTRTYRFRAHVPKQRGYPYEAGRSAVRRARVSG